jgi:hypothetical protein
MFLISMFWLLEGVAFCRLQRARKTCGKAVNDCFPEIVGIAQTAAADVVTLYVIGSRGNWTNGLDVRVFDYLFFDCPSNVCRSVVTSRCPLGDTVIVTTEDQSFHICRIGRLRLRGGHGNNSIVDP